MSDEDVWEFALMIAEHATPAPNERARLAVAIHDGIWRAYGHAISHPAYLNATPLGHRRTT